MQLVKASHFFLDPVSLVNAGLVKTQANKEQMKDALTALSLWLNSLQNISH